MAATILAAAYHLLELALTVFLVLWWGAKPIAVLVSRRLRRPSSGCAAADVSVLIPCHNMAQEIQETIRSLVENAGTLNLEILPIENNSTDNTWEVLQELGARYPQVRPLQIVPDPSERPTSASLNFGMQHASHPLIVRIDADTVVPPGSLEKLVEPLVTGGAVAVAGNVRVLHPTTVAERIQEIEYYRAMELSKPFEALYENILCCSGAFSAFQKEELLAAGGYHLDKLNSEDMELTMRMHKRGRVAYASDAVAYTDCPKTVLGLAVQRMRWTISGTVVLYIHRSGIGNRRYGRHGLIGLIGLPMRLLFTIRYGIGLFVKIGVAIALSQSLLSAVVAYIAISVVHGAAVLFGMLVSRPVASNAQGFRRIWMLPAFLAVYETFIFFADLIGIGKALVYIGRHTVRADARAWIHRAPPYWHKLSEGLGSGD